MTVTLDLAGGREIGENVLVLREAGKLIIVVDESKTIGLSSSGKMMGVASTGGFTAAGGELKINLYIGKKV